MPAKLPVTLAPALPATIFLAWPCTTQRASCSSPALTLRASSYQQNVAVDECSRRLQDASLKTYTLMSHLGEIGSASSLPMITYLQGSIRATWRIFRSPLRIKRLCSWISRQGNYSSSTGPTVRHLKRRALDKSDHHFLSLRIFPQEIFLFMQEAAY